MKTGIKISEIAPCGMNCGLCIGYLRVKNKCDGCQTPNTKCSKACTLRFCKERTEKYCDNSCPSFPCKRLTNLDRRYREKYGMSMIENLKQIEEIGIRGFIRNENKRWACPVCGDLICVHRTECLSCGTSRNQRRKNHL